MTRSPPEKSGPDPPDTVQYTYDPLGNLIRVYFDDGDSISYAVDGANRRVGRRLNGAWTHGWLYQNGLNVVAALDDSGGVESRYVYGADDHVPALMIKGGMTYRLITDHLGSVRAVVGVEEGEADQELNFSEWGIDTVTNDSFQALGYAGGLTDPATGLVRFGARDYDPVVGRWTAKDPIGFLGGSTNLYTYVDADPTNLIDPSGRVLDTALDAWGTAQDALCFLCNPSLANAGWLAADVVALAVPVIPAPGGLRVLAKGGLNLPFRSPTLRSQVSNVVRHFDQFGKPPKGVWQGGRRGGPRGLFENAQGKLPHRERGYYTETDVFPGSPGKRGPERLVFGRDGEVFYTPDHYTSFTQIR